MKKFIMAQFKTLMEMAMIVTVIMELINYVVTKSFIPLPI